MQITKHNWKIANKLICWLFFQKSFHVCFAAELIVSSWCVYVFIVVDILRGTELLQLQKEFNAFVLRFYKRLSSWIKVIHMMRRETASMYIRVGFDFFISNDIRLGTLNRNLLRISLFGGQIPKILESNLRFSLSMNILHRSGALSSRPMALLMPNFIWFEKLIHPNVHLGKTSTEVRYRNEVFTENGHGAFDIGHRSEQLPHNEFSLGFLVAQSHWWHFREQFPYKSADFGKFLYESFRKHKLYILSSELCWGREPKI